MNCTSPPPSPVAEVRHADDRGKTVPSCGEARGGAGATGGERPRRPAHAPHGRRNPDPGDVEAHRPGRPHRPGPRAGGGGAAAGRPAAPGGGAALVGLVLLAEARRLKASRWTRFRMAVNYGLDMLVGAIPVLGDAFDFFFKAHRKNLRLLQEDTARRR